MWPVSAWLQFLLEFFTSDIGIKKSELYLTMNSFLSDVMRATTASLSSARNTFVETMYSNNPVENKIPSTTVPLEKTPIFLENKLMIDQARLASMRQSYLQVKR